MKIPLDGLYFKSILMKSCPVNVDKGLSFDFFSTPLLQGIPKKGHDCTQPFSTSTLSLCCLPSRINNFRGKNPPVLLSN